MNIFFRIDGMSFGSSSVEVTWSVIREDATVNTGYHSTFPLNDPDLRESIVKAMEANSPVALSPTDHRIFLGQNLSQSFTRHLTEMR